MESEDIPHQGAIAPEDGPSENGPSENGPSENGPEHLAPTRPSTRLRIIDGLRGFAILGILSANLPLFIGPGIWGVASANSGEGPDPFGRVYGFLVAFLSEGKFITALALLLGLGLALQAERSERSGRSPARFLLRRLLVLGVIGLCHALLVWSGDVLLFYAVLGLPFLLFVGRPPATLVKWSLGILVVLVVGGILVSGTVAMAAFSGEGAAPGQAYASDSVSAATPSFVKELVREAHGPSGSYSDQVLARSAKALIVLPGGLTFSGPMVFSMMLLGAATARSGLARKLASDPYEATATTLEASEGESAIRANPRLLLRRVALAGIGVGLGLNLFWAVVQELPGLVPAAYDQALLILAGTLWMVGAPALALGWMALLAPLLGGVGRSGGSWIGSWISQRLAAVGKMALSNYLAQSIIMTGFLYSSGLYGEISYGWAALLMAGVWAAELLWSKPYLERFGFGPVEWVWRKLSYGL